MIIIVFDWADIWRTSGSDSAIPEVASEASHGQSRVHKGTSKYHGSDSHNECNANLGFLLDSWTALVSSWEFTGE